MNRFRLLTQTAVTDTVGDMIACPHDENFYHDPFYGCIPNDFSENTLGSHIATRTSTGWSGGCSKHMNDFLIKWCEDHPESEYKNVYRKIY